MESGYSTKFKVKRGRPVGRLKKAVSFSLPINIVLELEGMPRGERSRFVTRAIRKALADKEMYTYRSQKNA